MNFTVNDGELNSNTVARTVIFTAINDAPVISGIEATPISYTENDSPVEITDTLGIADLDDTLIESATLAISANFAGPEDVLGFNNQSGISGFYNVSTGVLTLTGPASLADYEAAIQSVTYHNTSDDPSALTRTISVSVSDGDVSSNLLSRKIELTAVNDAPALATIEGLPASFTENGAPINVTQNLSLIHI